LSASQVPEIEAVTAGVVVALMDESMHVIGVLLSPTDYHELLLSAAQSVRAVAAAKLREDGRRGERPEIKQLAVKTVRRISQLPEATISQLADGGRITLTSQAGTAQGILLDLAEYELLRAAEALQMRAPIYRRMLEEGGDEWQGRETIKW
jgi:hypothetical protein